MSKLLTITATPFKSSNLALPPSPFSPRLPLTPRGPSLQKQSSSTTNFSRPIKSTVKEQPQIAPPPHPLHWLWQCHMCNRVYQLGVTRRCLDDGHYFCAGTTTVKKSKRTNRRIIRHQACASEFDYQGWKAWGTWRRAVLAATCEDECDDNVSLSETSAVVEADKWLHGARTDTVDVAKAARDLRHKDCWETCDYPSQCQWGKQYGVKTPTLMTFLTPDKRSLPPAVAPLSLVPGVEAEPKTTFDNILGDILTTRHENGPSPRDQAEQTPDGSLEAPSMDDLLASVKRRKRKSAGALPSPLGSHPPSPTTPESEERATMPQKLVQDRATRMKAVLASTTSTSNYVLKALDDFDLELKKSFERASEYVGGLTLGKSSKSSSG